MLTCIAVKFIFDSVLLDLSSSVNILQIAGVALRVVFLILAIILPSSSCSWRVNLIPWTGSLRAFLFKDTIFYLLHFPKFKTLPVLGFASKSERIECLILPAIYLIKSHFCASSCVPILAAYRVKR